MQSSKRSVCAYLLHTCYAKACVIREQYIPIPESRPVQVDRNEDMLRSCLRAIDSCAHIPNVETCTAFRLFMDNTVHQPSLSAKYLAIKKEREEAEGLDISSSA